jgi:hypothetical protein
VEVFEALDNDALQRAVVVYGRIAGRTFALVARGVS